MSHDDRGIRVSNEAKDKPRAQNKTDELNGLLSSPQEPRIEQRFRYREGQREKGQGEQETNRTPTK